MSSRGANSITRSNIPTSGLFLSEQPTFWEKKVFSFCCLVQAQDIPLSLPQAATQSRTSCVDCWREISFSVHALTQQTSRQTQESREAVLPLESHGITLPTGCFLVPAQCGVTIKQFYADSLEHQVSELVLTSIASAIFGSCPCGYYWLKDLD